jgi:tetratricopeptide (TPR) repeat protein
MGVLAADSVENTTVPLEAMEIGAVKARTAGLLLSGQAGGTVDGALIWSLSGHDEDGRVEVPFVIEVDGGTLLAGRVGSRIAIGIYAYVIDGDGRIVDHIAQGLVLDPEPYRDRIVGSGLKFIGRFALESGDYTLRVMVQNIETDNYFMSWSVLTLPAAGDPEPQLLPPLFPDPDTPWIVVRQNGEEATITVGGEAEVLPAARPALVENQPAEIYLGGGGWDPAALVEVRIIDELGRTVSEPLVEFSGTPTGDFQFRRGVLSPVDLPPGEYSMIVTLADEKASEVLRRAMRLTVVRDGELKGWARVVQPDLTPGATETPEDREEAQKVSKKEIRAAYRRALRPLGDGDAVTARRMVAEFERRATAVPSRTAVSTMSEAEFAEAKAVAKANPICLMPLALLHRDLYRGYSARREGILASHARKMAVTYAEQLGRMKPYSGFSEALMVNIASDLAQAGSSSAARNLLERALQVNPGYRPALLSLGFSFERASNYIEASKAYQSLVNTHPTFDEGRLRLAINLIRTGRGGAGEELLRDLGQDDARPWIEAIAAQELVRLLIKKDRGSEAEREVRAALERMADDQRLWILFAAILERTNRHTEAIEIMEDLPPAGRGVSPRARYAEWPALGVKASQVRLTARAAEANPALKAALGGSG